MGSAYGPQAYGSGQSAKEDPFISSQWSWTRQVDPLEGGDRPSWTDWRTVHVKRGFPRGFQSVGGGGMLKLGSGGIPQQDPLLCGIIELGLASNLKRIWQFLSRTEEALKKYFFSLKSYKSNVSSITRTSHFCGKQYVRGKTIPKKSAMTRIKIQQCNKEFLSMLL